MTEIIQASSMNNTFNSTTRTVDQVNFEAEEEETFLQGVI